MQELKKSLNKAGFGVVSLDYRLVSKTVHFPAPIADCKDAIRWVRANASTYNFDPDNIGLWGGSAGGHLALLAAYTNDQQWMGDSGLAPVSAHVKYVVDNFGPTDMNEILRTEASRFSIFLARIFTRKLLPIREKLIYAITGYSINDDKEKVIETARLYSPLLYVSSAVVPTIIFHGTKDKVVPIGQSEKLYQLLNTNGVKTEYVVVKNSDHGFNNISKAETDALVQQVVNYVITQTQR